MIPFNKPVTEFNLDNSANNLSKFCGDGPYTQKCSNFLGNKFQSPKNLLTTSCTHALEMAALLLEIQPGDEIIMPSYTFVSTANAFVLRGAKIVFVDIRPDTMNINEKLIKGAITNKTKVIAPVHYAGVACEMDTILDIAKKNNLFVVEDAAQGVMSTYKGRYLGSIGDFGTYSFHETKNYHCGEGGALLVNNKKFIERAEIIREKGTNRSRFLRGQVDKYTWVDIGSSYLPSELNAAYLWRQLENVEQINNDRIKSWNLYYERLNRLEVEHKIHLPFVPEYVEHNAHMFYIKVKNLSERTEIIEHLKNNQIQAVFHYIPLHSSPAGIKYSRFQGEDIFTTKESERLLRLPLWYGMSEKDIHFVCDVVIGFFEKKL